MKFTAGQKLYYPERPANLLLYPLVTWSVEPSKYLGVPAKFELKRGGRFLATFTTNVRVAFEYINNNNVNQLIICSKKMLLINL